MNKIIKWMKNHEPLDWKLIIIIILLIHILKKDLVWFVMIIAGMTSYGYDVDYQPIIDDGSVKIADAYNSAMTTLFELGLKWGETLHPHNLIVVKIINFFIIALVISITLYMLFLIIHMFVYKRPRK